MDGFKGVGYMSCLPNCRNPEGYYILHHTVLNECSSTTKPRVVFDASRRTSSGKPLNYLHYTCSTIQENIFCFVLCSVAEHQMFTEVHLLFLKSRVSHLKKLILPTVELYSALLILIYTKR